MEPPHPAKSRARRPLFGRSEVVVEVERALDELGSPEARAVLLVGSGGVGKSTVLDEIAARASGRGYLLVRGRALPGELPAPFLLVREMLSSIEEREPADAFAAPRTAGEASRAAADDPGGAAADDLEGLLAPLGRTSVEGLVSRKEAIHHRLLEHLRELARARPLALLVDDLHLADGLSLEFFERLAREGPAARVGFVATVDRGPLVPGRTRETIDRLVRDPGFRTLTIRPFSPAEVAAFATWLRDGLPPAPDDVLRWHAETEGHPLLLELVVRSASGASRYAERGGAVPADLTQALLARVRQLDDLDRRVISYAAVLGREFDFARLRAAVDVPEERLSEAVERFVRDGFLRERGEEVYEFASEEFRASVYAGVTETRRAILHRRVARALEARGGASDFELARHYYLGKDEPKALEYGVRAADAAARAFDLDTALALVRQSLEVARRLPARDRPLEIRLLTEAGRLLGETGDLAGSEEVLTEAVDLARAEPEADLLLGRALLGLAWARVERSDHAAAEPLALEAATLLEKAGRPRDRFASHRVLGQLYWRRSDFELAESHQRAALALAEEEGTPHERGHALIDVANTLLPRGSDFVEATLALYERAAALFATENDPNALARVLMNRSVLEHRLGRTDEALRDVGRALDAAERSRSPVWIGYCLVNLAQWQAELGRTDVATRMIDRAERTLAPTGDRLAQQQVQMIRGLIAEKDGRFDDAETRYLESLENARWMGLKGEIAEMLFRRAHLAWLRGDRGRARDLLDEARRAGLATLRTDLTGDARALSAALEEPANPAR